MDLCRERPQLSNSFRSSHNALLFPRFLLTSFQRSAHSVTVPHTCSSVDHTSLQRSRYTRHGCGETKSCWVVFSTSSASSKHKNGMLNSGVFPNHNVCKAKAAFLLQSGYHTDMFLSLNSVRSIAAFNSSPCLCGFGAFVNP